MNILTSTCGRLSPEPCIPVLLQSLLIQDANQQYFEFEVGKLLWQKSDFGECYFEQYHFFNRVEEDYTISLQADTTYLLVNLLHTFQGRLDQSEIELYERGFYFFRSEDGRILWNAKANHEYKFVLIALNEEMVNSFFIKYPHLSVTLAMQKNSKTDIISKYTFTPKLLNLYHLLENTHQQEMQQKVLLNIVEGCLSQMNSKPFPHASKLKEHEINRIYLFKHILQDQMHTEISIESIANDLGLNERRLRTGFRRIYGVSIFEYLLYLRMERAMVLISHSSIKINKIANMVGYQSKFTFAAAFRKYFKNKPSFKRREKS
ncbi:AraC family transcriptional regulator [Gynurincola endophyticus]|uniref:AraC family transcriptional regulator n=1 Tax=Gynurincola endophyticus TaxID=2479004 RepID=UPI000F8D81EE|nr:AraC family transcriptional regulator [Gynurincola endophyticus]